MAENIENFVDKDEFNAKLRSINEKSNRPCWDRSREEQVINILKERELKNFKKTSAHYQCSKLYDLVKIGNNCEKIILKREDESKPLVFKLAYQDYFEKLVEAHVNTGHGGRDRILYYCRNKWIIPKPACSLFVSLCQICARKKNQTKIWSRHQAYCLRRV